jgi:hypothetical protein
VHEVPMQALCDELFIEVVEAVTHARVLITHIIIIIVVFRHLLLIEQTNNFFND